MQKEIILSPQPKIIQIQEKSGIRLSSILKVYLNKHKIRDYAMQISNKLYKHFGIFIEIGAISDSYIEKKYDDNYLIAFISTEDTYLAKKKNEINEYIEGIIRETKNSVQKFITDKKIDSNNKKLDDLVNESFSLKIFNENIMIISKSIDYFNYGIQTLIQIMENSIFQHDNPDSFIILPDVFVVDFSAVKIRGFHLDLGKLGYNLDYLEDYITLLGKFRINHVVLTSYEDIDKKKYEKIKLRCEFNNIELLYAKSNDLNSHNLDEIISDKIISEKMFDRKTLSFPKIGSKSGELLPIFNQDLKNIIKSVKLSENSGFNAIIPIFNTDVFNIIEFYKFIIPIVADIFWNPNNYYMVNPDNIFTDLNWNYLLKLLSLNLFEVNPKETNLESLKLIFLDKFYNFPEEFTKPKLNISIIKKNISNFNKIKSVAYENKNLIEMYILLHKIYQLIFNYLFILLTIDKEIKDLVKNASNSFTELKEPLEDKYESVIEFKENIQDLNEKLKKFISNRDSTFFKGDIIKYAQIFDISKILVLLKWDDAKNIIKNIIEEIANNKLNIPNVENFSNRFTKLIEIINKSIKDNNIL